MTRRAPRFRPGCETLEGREVPAALAESFEAVALPAGFSQWSKSGTDSFVTSTQTVFDGGRALAATGTAAAESRFWSGSSQPADTTAGVRVLSSAPTPVSLLVRGSGLDTPTPTYLAAVVSPGGRQVSVVEVRSGVAKLLGSVSRAGGDFGLWFNLSVQPAGNSATVRLQRPDTREYLNPQGQWQVAAVDAVTAATTLTTGGLVGVGRSHGAAGLAFFDALTTTLPAVVVTPLPPVVPPPPAGPPSPVTVPIVESFDSTGMNAIPVGWQEWASDGSAGFGTSAARAVAGNGLSASGNSATAARAWLGSTQPADVQAAASVYVDTLIPAGVVVRGSGLSTAKPTFYSLTAVRGTEVKLVATVSGVETTLGTVKSAEYVSQKWLRLTLTVVGDQLRAVVVRTDTGRWLTPDGDWSDVPQPALTATNTQIPGGGFVGLTRSARAAGAVSFDDVTVTPGAAVAGPAVTLTANQSPAAVTGDLTLTAAAPGARRTEFRLNGTLRAVGGSWILDTTSLANGPVTVEVRATDDAGNVGTTSATYILANPNPSPAPTRPDLPRKLPNVRVAMLAYSGTPLGATEKARLADSVDLVVANPQFLGTIDAVSPGTQQLVYTNLSNLYGGLLTDWLAYADKSGVSRELAFYHVTQATPFNGGSPSSQPVNWLWQVSRGALDLTAAARGGRSFGIAFGAAGEAVSIGQPDKFRELNFDLTRAAAGGWQGVYEYVSRVNADGTPAGWTPLALLSDTTLSLAKPGRVLFDPPADWAAARVSGGDLLYTVRVRTVVTGTPPEAKTIYGRDSVGAFGTIKGTIPAFDSSADRDGDGYLSDAEYANRRAGQDARFVYESRLFYPQYGQMRFVTNPAASAVRRWAADYHARLLATLPLADGLFLDNANGRLPFAGIPVQEPTAGYADDSAGLVAAVWKAVAPKIVLSNTAGGFDDATPIARAGTGVLEEFALRPLDATWAAVQDVSNLVKSRLAADSPSPYTILDTHPGSFATTDPRVRAATLAYYYLVADPDRTAVMFFGGLNPSADWDDTFIPSVRTDLGKPLGEMTTWAGGSDPQNAALGYKVFGRQYANALTLYKPRSYTLGQGTGTTDDATATTHQLGGRYRVLNPDNTLGAVVTSVMLRNGEGAILMKV